MKTVRKKVITLCLALLGLSLLTNCSSINRSHIGAGLGGKGKIACISVTPKAVYILL